MIITRTGGQIEFQLSETRRVSVDITRISSAALAIERGGDGRLHPSLILSEFGHHAGQRIEAGMEMLAVMHARIIEVMREIGGPAAATFAPKPVPESYLPY